MVDICFYFAANFLEMMEIKDFQHPENASIFMEFDKNESTLRGILASLETPYIARWYPW